MWSSIITNMSDGTMKNEKNSGVSDAAVGKTPPVHSYSEFKQIAFRPRFSQLLPCLFAKSQQISNPEIEHEEQLGSEPHVLNRTEISKCLLCKYQFFGFRPVRIRSQFK